MNRDTERAFEAVKREVRHHRFMVHEICAAYLGCDVDDVILRVRKKTYPGSTPEDRKESKYE